MSDVLNEKGKGIRVSRHFTQDNCDVYKEVAWSFREVQIDGGTRPSQEVEFPTFWTEDSARIVASKYLYTYKDGDNGIRRENSLKQIIDRIVDTIAEAGAKGGYFYSEEDAQVFSDELKYMMIHQYFAFNSPVWFNIGTPEKQQASACFINEVQDSMDSIMKLATDEAMIFRLGSGAGVNLSRIREKGAPLTGGGEASGPVSFMKGYDAFAGVIKSGGKKRRAAKMVILNDDHPDIMEFISSKTKEEAKVQALIDAGYDSHFDAEDGAYQSVFFQNANHSVRVSDAFMEAVVNDGEWELKSRVEGISPKVVRARDIWRAMAQTAWECGDPGVQFDDTIHTWHTCKNAGRQEATNPCSEYLFLNNTACNLASLNLMKFIQPVPTGHKLDVQSFTNAVRLIIIAQDILVGYADYPTESIERETKKWRTLGLGYANLGGLLMQMGEPYDSETGRIIASGITSLMTATAYATSAELAKHLGPFEGFEENRDPMLEVVRRHYEHAQHGWSTFSIPNHHSIDKWREAVEGGSSFGFRNAQVTVLAPTGTISFAMGCDTTGIEPAMSLVSYKSLVGGGVMKLVNKIVPEVLASKGYTETQIDDILSHIDEHGDVEGAPHLSESFYPIFDCAFPARKGGRSISWEGHIKMMAAVQPFLSGAISKTVNMPNDATVEDVEDAYMMAWREGIKALAIYRDGCKLSQPVTTKDPDLEETSEKEYPQTETPGPVRRKLPDTRASITHKFRVGGQKGYITVGLYEDGSPGELFVTMNKEGSTISGLIDSFATAVSIALQYGAPVQDMVQKFKHTNFEPSGFTGNPAIRTATSIVDYIFKWLETEFLEAENLEETTSSTDLLAEKLYQDNLAPSDTPLCIVCGNTTVRSGTCFTCTTCGETTGCG